MNKIELIEWFFYLGYATGCIILLAVLILFLYIIFFYLLRFKRLRNITFRVIITNEVNSMNDNEFASLIHELKRARY